jgi:hypothetical protein
MTFASYSQNCIPEFTMIAGNDYTLEFVVYEDDGVTPMDIGGATTYWLLSPYGQPDYTIAQISGVVTATNKFEVVIPSATTQGLSGVYIQQPVLISFPEPQKEYRPGQGTIIIQDGIQYT